MPPKQASTENSALNDGELVFLAAVFGSMEKPNIDYTAVAASVGYASDKVAYNKWRAIVKKMGWFQEGPAKTTKGNTVAGNARVTKRTAGKKATKAVVKDEDDVDEEEANTEHEEEAKPKAKRGRKPKAPAKKVQAVEEEDAGGEESSELSEPEAEADDEDKADDEI